MAMGNVKRASADLDFDHRPSGVSGHPFYARLNAISTKPASPVRRRAVSGF